VHAEAVCETRRHIVNPTVVGVFLAGLRAIATASRPDTVLGASACECTMSSIIITPWPRNSELLPGWGCCSGCSTKRFFEGTEAELDVARGGRGAHQADAPGFALEVAEASADLEAVVGKKLRAHGAVVDAFRDPNQSKGRETVLRRDGKLQPERFKAIA
jgi:hypothetical protein